MVEWVFVAGIPVHSGHVLTLATLIKDPELAHKLAHAAKRDLIVIRLDELERASALKALAEPQAGLEELRTMLLAEQARRQDEVLAAETAA